jgi:uncharacterized protein (TIGR00730 family)
MHPQSTPTMSQRPIRRVCVFCGSRPGKHPEFAAAARALGAGLVARGWELVYGGGSVGLMGAVADAVLEAGGHVIGVIPEFLATRELLHAGVADMRVVDSMHTRKALMCELSDAFVGLPGGYGTFEELFEMVTWAQLGLHAKPVGLLDTRGFYAPFAGLVRHAVDEGFIKTEQKALIFVDDDPVRLLDQLPGHDVPFSKKWLEPDQA